MLARAPTISVRTCALYALVCAQHQLFRAICPAHPHTPSLHPCLGTFKPEFGPRALPPHVPDRAHNGSPARATLSMPSYPRHRASDLEGTRNAALECCLLGASARLPRQHEHPSHMRARRVRRLAKPYRVSLPPITRRSPSPPHRSEQAAKASRRQRRSSSPSTRHIRARPRGYHHHGGICHHHG